MKIVVLGSGTSHGIPVIGCSCPVCASLDSRDKRMRCSLYVEGALGERAVIDTGPEFRLQALAAGIPALDAVFLTHAHADHIHGLDDVRPLSREKAVPVYGSAETITEFRERFAYIFRVTQSGGGKPRIETRACKPGERVRLGGLAFTAIPVKHGGLDIFGWRVDEERGGGSAVYLTDTSHIDENAYALIGKPALLIIGALRKRAHKTHFTFDQALEAALRIGAEKTCLTHICHEHSHREIGELCRDFTETRHVSRLFSPAFDGLELFA